MTIRGKNPESWYEWPYNSKTDNIENDNIENVITLVIKFTEGGEKDQQKRKSRNLDENGEKKESKQL